MIAGDPNVELLTRMVEALGDLRERLVFVGGCATVAGYIAAFSAVPRA